MDIERYFPYETIRTEQKQVLEQISDNWEDKKYIILELGTGVGKSGIAKTVANWSKDAFIVTDTKQLQQQYLDDFERENNIASIKGRANYQCNRNPRLNCENGPCNLKMQDIKIQSCFKTCKYYCARTKALATKIVITSYAYLFRAFDCAGFWKKRQLMVFDECHLLENQLINFACFEINPKELEDNYGLYDSLGTVADIKHAMRPFTYEGWDNNEDRFIETFDLVDKKHKELFDIIKEELGTETDAANLDEETLDNLSTTHKLFYKLDKLLKKMEWFQSFKKDDWIISPTPDGVLQFIPLYIDSLFAKMCDHWADKFLFMSATILDTEGFISDLGIDREKCLVIKMDSTFDPNKSPIYYMPCGNMSYNKIDETLPKVCSIVESIIKSKNDQKGLIHTGNYKVAKYIYENISDNKRLLMKVSDEVTNQNLLKIHSRTKDTILLSPSMTTGVDLDEDLSRFQVVIKMPFSSLADTRIKRKSELNSEWYACQMLKTLVQACGRSTRSSEDHSVTYVLDSSFKYWITKYKKWLPQSFLGRIRGF